VRGGWSGPEAEGRATQLPEPAVDHLDRDVAGSASVEERADVGGAPLQPPPERDDLGERGRDAGLTEATSAVMDFFPDRPTFLGLGDTPGI